MEETTMTRTQEPTRAARDEHAELEALVTRFTDAFNRDDLDGVMAFMAEDAIYDEFNGTRHRGKTAIRKAFVPQFRGDHGKLRFHTEDLFVDTKAGKALIRWVCTLETKRGPAAWRGLDILHVEHGRITEKHTYAKAKSLLLTDPPAGLA
jgi:ketosteroid isomerase-like protein